MVLVFICRSWIENGTNSITWTRNWRTRSSYFVLPIETGREQNRTELVTNSKPEKGRRGRIHTCAAPLVCLVFMPKEGLGLGMIIGAVRLQQHQLNSTQRDRE